MTDAPMGRCHSCAFVGVIMLDGPRMMWLYGYKGTITNWLVENGYMTASKMDHAIECPKCGGYDIEGNGCVAFINEQQKRRRERQ